MILSKTETIDGVTITAHELSVSQYCDLLHAMGDTLIESIESYQLYLLSNPSDGLARAEQVIKSSKPLNKLTNSQQEKAIVLFMSVNPYLFKESPKSKRQREIATRTGAKPTPETASSHLRAIQKNICVMVQNGHTGAADYGMSFFDLAINELIEQQERAKNG